MNGPLKLSEYLAQLLTDLDLLAEYRRDKSQALANSGLVPEHQDVLLRGNLDEIREVLLQEGGDEENPVQLCIIFGWP